MELVSIVIAFQICFVRLDVFRVVKIYIVILCVVQSCCFQVVTDIWEGVVSIFRLEIYKAMKKTKHVLSSEKFIPNLA
jgi:hypothetical protein